MQAARIDRYVVRLAPNCTARRNELPPRKHKGRPPEYGALSVRWLRTWKERTLPASPPDVVSTFGSRSGPFASTVGTMVCARTRRWPRTTRPTPCGFSSTPCIETHWCWGPTWMRSRNHLLLILGPLVRRIGAPDGPAIAGPPAITRTGLVGSQHPDLSGGCAASVAYRLLGSPAPAGYLAEARVFSQSNLEHLQ